MAIKQNSILMAVKRGPGIALVFLVIFVPMTFKLISPVFILAGLGEYTDLIMPALMIIGLFLSIRYFVSFIRFPDVLFYALFALFILGSPNLYPQNKPCLFDR